MPRLCASLASAQWPRKAEEVIPSSFASPDATRVRAGSLSSALRNNPYTVCRLAIRVKSAERSQARSAALLKCPLPTARATSPAAAFAVFACGAILVFRACFRALLSSTQRTNRTFRTLRRR